MAQSKHVWLIAAKDLKQFIRDRTALIMFVFMPFIFVVIFSSVFRGAGSADTRLSLHLVTREPPGGLSHQLISGMATADAADLPPGQPAIVWDKDYAAALQAVTDRKLDGFLAFPEDFTQSIMMGYGTSLELIVNPANTSIRAALGGLAGSIASEVGAQQLVHNAAISLIVEQRLASGSMADVGADIQQVLLSQPGAGASGAAISYRTDSVGPVEAGNPANWVIPGYLVMFMFFAAAQSASVIVRERQNNTLERLLTTSARKETILAGMFVGTLARGLVQIGVFWTAGVLLFKLDLGQSPLAVILLSFIMALVSASFAIMLATLSKTEKSAGALATLVSLALAPLGGCWWPLFITPQWMQSLARLTPHGWATTGFNELMVVGAGMGAVTVNMVVLIGFALAFGVIAVARFRTNAV